jgi:TPR repeat protein
MLEVDRTITVAYELLTRAAEYLLAQCLMKGVGVQCDPEQAAYYFRLSADRGHPEGVTNALLISFLLTPSLSHGQHREMLFRRNRSAERNTASSALLQTRCGQGP